MKERKKERKPNSVKSSLPSTHKVNTVIVCCCCCFCCCVHVSIYTDEEIFQERHDIGESQDFSISHGNHLRIVVRTPNVKFYEDRQRERKKDRERERENEGRKGSQAAASFSVYFFRPLLVLRVFIRIKYKNNNNNNKPKN